MSRSPLVSSSLHGPEQDAGLNELCCRHTSRLLRHHLMQASCLRACMQGRQAAAWVPAQAG